MRGHASAWFGTVRLRRSSHKPASRPTTPLRAKRRTKVSMSPRAIQNLAHFRGWGEEESSKSVN